MEKRTTESYVLILEGPFFEIQKNVMTRQRQLASLALSKSQGNLVQNVPSLKLH